jgi:hypothetical protein
MSYKTGRTIKWVILCLVLASVFYIFILFPNIEKDMKKEPVIVNIESWHREPLDSLSYYYLESDNIPSVSRLLENTIDSIFVVNYLKSHRNSVTLRNPKKYLVYFTNNYSMKTLKCYSYYLKTKNEDYLKLFWANANWMYDNVKIVNDTVALWTNDNMIYDKYNLDFGWASAFGQGVGLSVLSRAYQISKDEKYIILAEKVLNSFNLDYKKGGILNIDDNGNYWYLEYPSNPPAYVLNGFIFGLFGIYDYWRISNSPKAFICFQRGINTLKRNLHKYDKGYWSAYDLEYNKYCAGYNYHKNVHIPQLKVLYQLTGDEAFKIYASKFSKYLSEPYFTMFKIKFTIDAISRRLSYKNPFKHLSKERFQ